MIVDKFCKGRRNFARHVHIANLPAYTNVILPTALRYNIDTIKRSKREVLPKC